MSPRPFSGKIKGKSLLRKRIPRRLKNLSTSRPKKGSPMKALMKTDYGPGHVEIRDIDRPVIPAPDWVLIRVMAAGICGTDVHIWQDKFNYWPPVTLGHEFSGVVTEIGANCKRFKAGDRVVVEPQVHACGVCEYCRSGRMHMCQEKWTLGWRVNGCFCDTVAAPEMFLHRIPDGVSFELAALCEPLAVAVYDVAEHGRININDFVVVQGSGPIGILAAYMAKRLGARTVVLTGVSASEYCRFPAALKLGADFVINVQKENLPEKVAELSGGKGVDCVIETSGVPSAIAQSIDMLRKGGRLIGIGIPGDKTIPVPWKDAVMKSLEFYFSMSTSYTAWDKALCLMQADAGLLRQVVTWTGALEDWEAVFQSLVEEKNIKAVFVLA